ncbi:MAG: hypothetical protein NT062_22325 [Proteobacteria bacterium]|nr:hypothetical protein [Pseudomonadota bacterium]
MIRGVLLGGLLAGCSSPSVLDPAPPIPSPPRATVVDEAAWAGRALLGELLPEGPGAGLGDRKLTPGTEVRLLRDATAVHVRVTASDRDVVAADGVTIAIGPVTRTLAAHEATPIPGGWRVEVALDRAQLGPSPVAVRVSRCDASSSARTPSCATWSTTIEPD